MSDPDRPFFVGYLPVPAGLRGFLLLVSAVLIWGFALFSWGVGSTQEDPGPGRFRFDYGRQALTGVISMVPYPMLHVTEGTDHIGAGQSIMLAGGGKFGVAGRVADFDGALVTLQGVVLERGDLNMLQLAGGNQGVMPAEGEVPDVETTDLGRWRLSGEICDGKCLAGAMRPGRGIAHRACASLCLIGEVPPVFVSSEPVQGHEFFLVGREDGTPIDRAILEYVGLLVMAEGRVSLRGDLPVFILDEDTLEALE
ncbi:hypothetical protein E2K80_10745 [Rhodophyticola sp. CCM32]|uniref:hypothetical protein n=1 Tax=Rhodophyticola sp. CCM32 TaxID=2916397 RepID=UPI00107FD39C|nr:hypothetical protein [Rhodophyticola sp. CCM32]QBY01142.1 hypothetical protein E2K80_10745 [Rhodophyticola sp. CCM32]